MTLPVGKPAWATFYNVCAYRQSRDKPVIDDSPRTTVPRSTVLTKSEADALAALLSPRPSRSLFGPVIDLRQSPEVAAPSAKPLFGQPRSQPADPPTTTIAKPIFERPGTTDRAAAAGVRSTVDARPLVPPRLTVPMGDAVPVGFVPAGEPVPESQNRRWFLALALLVLGGLVAALFTLGGDKTEVDADGGPAPSSAISTLGVTTTRPATTASTTVSTTAAPTTVSTTVAPTTTVAAPTSTAAPAAAPAPPPTTTRRTTTTTRRRTTTTEAPTTTVVQAAPQTTVTFAPPTWSVTPAPTSAPPATAPPTTAPPTSPPVTSPPPTSAATSAVQQ